MSLKLRGLSHSNRPIEGYASPSEIQELAYELKVEEAMSADIIAVEPGNTMRDVRELLRLNRISGLPVVEHEKLIGIVSLKNFITCLMNEGIDETVRDNMTAKVTSLYSYEPLIYAINQFEQLGYGRFPVVERETGKLVGMLTKGDVIECFLKRLHIQSQEEEISTYRASHLFDDLHSGETTLILRYQIQGGNYKGAGEQSGYLKINLLRLGIPSQIVRRITVASCEAEMNIIIFTGGGKLIACIEEDFIKINAVDHGPGIPDIEKAMRSGYSTAPDKVREMGFGAGMGLPNIKSCSNEMRIDSKPGEGTNLELIFYTANGSG